MLAAGGLLLAMTIVAYWPVYRAQFIWDDEQYVVKNANLRTLAGLTNIWFVPRSSPQYYPLVHTTFWIEYHLWKLHPLGYHLVNVLLHATSAILFWRLLARLNVPGAWLAAAIFAVHPVEVESVAWVTERKNVLAGVLALASLLAYFRFSPPNGATGTSSEAGRVPIAHDWRWYAPSLFLFLAALFSKTVVCSLPAVVLVILWWKRGRIRVRDVLPLAPFFAFGLALGLYTAYLERTHVGATGPLFDALSPLDRCLLAGRALWFYAEKLVWPANLTFWYPRWQIDPYAWQQYLFPLGALLVMVALWLARGRLGRGPLAAVAIFAGALAPALGFFNVYPMRFSFVADHFQYHASLALIALFAASCALAAARLRRDERWIGRWAAAILLATLAVLTYQQTRVYYDLKTLYADVIDKNPASEYAYSNLGVHLKSLAEQADAQQRYDEALRRREEALALFRQANRLNSEEPSFRNNLGSMLLNLGDTNDDRQGYLDEAVAHLREALRLDDRRHDAHNNLGFALVKLGRPDEAAQHFAQALEINPNYPEALYGMGTVLGQRHRIAEAHPFLKRALELKPNYPEAHHGMALVLIDQGRLEEAAEHLKQSISLDATLADAHYMLGVVRVKQGRMQDAIRHLSNAIRCRPNFADAQHILGVVLLNVGQIEQAIPYFEAASRLKPEHPEFASDLRKARQAKQAARRK